jgi:GT2 family glycosyltransferase
LPVDPDARVGAVVLSWNSLGFIDTCLQSLRQHEPRVALYIVDNGSTDGSCEHLRRRYPEAQIIENGHNLGFAGGSNVGMRQAVAEGCQYVLLLNNDTAIDEPFVDRCLDVLARDPEIGIVGPVVVEMKQPDTVQCLGGSINLWNLTFAYRGAGSRFERRDQAVEVGYVLGAAMLIRTTVLTKIGFLDEEYFPAYVEEADLCHRAKLAGFKSVVYEGSRIRHQGSASSGGSLTSYRRYAANCLRFAFKHLSAAQFIVATQLIAWRGLYWKMFRRRYV